MPAAPCRKRACSMDARTLTPGEPAPFGAAKKMRLGASATTTKEHAAGQRCCSSDLCLLKYEGCHGFRVAGRYMLMLGQPHWRVPHSPISPFPCSLACVRTRLARARRARAGKGAFALTTCCHVGSCGHAGRRAWCVTRRSHTRARASTTSSPSCPRASCRLRRPRSPARRPHTVRLIANSTTAAPRLSAGFPTPSCRVLPSSLLPPVYFS